MSNGPQYLATPIAEKRQDPPPRYGMTYRTPGKTKDDTILELLTPWKGAWGGQTYVLDYAVAGNVLWTVREREDSDPKDVAAIPVTGTSR